MKTINFSVKEILPSLLDKTKTQTIRKQEVAMTYKTKTTYEPAKYKVGEEVKILWNQGSKYKCFCSECGKGRKKQDCICKEKGCKQLVGFNKLLGTAKITEVFKVEMHKYLDGDRNTIKYFTLRPYHGTLDDSDLAKRDGFKDKYQMFNVIDKMYDLENPKKFWIYRWKWNK